MSCSQFDLKAYFLGEVAEPDRRPLEEHVKACQGCREELERLSVTRATLVTLADEEIPRRIAFVSDKVFEPRGWRRLWDSGPRLGFASAAVLSMAILVHAFVRPAPVAPPPAAIDVAAIEARVEAEAARRVRTELEKVIAESDRRQTRTAAEMVAAVEGRLERQRRADLLAVEENVNVLRKLYALTYRASNDVGRP